MKKCRVLRITIILLLFSFITVNATEVTTGKPIWYVHPDSTLNSIQAALDSCSSNDIVLVAPGTYVENIIWPDTNGIHLISELEPEVTIIDGDSVGSVISIMTGVDTTTVIRGFTITNGLSNYGGGIWCDHSSPTINNNIITNNEVFGEHFGGGGGIFCIESSPIITENKILENKAHWGGGICCVGNSSPTISHNIIIENTATYPGGGGIFCLSNASPIIYNCTISRNNNDGIYCKYTSRPVINYNDIFGNIGYGVINIDSNVIVNAEYNWWGDGTGPYHPDSNPGGMGDSVSNYVDFNPWLTTGVEEQEPIQTGFFVSQANPNPFINKTQIEYYLPQSCNVNIIIYNTLGVKIKTILNKRQNAGTYTTIWNGCDEKGNKLPNGFYFLRLEAGEYEGTRKLLLIR